MRIMGKGKHAPKYEWKESIITIWPYNLAHVITYGDGTEVSDEEASQMYNLYIPYLFNLLSTVTEREREVIELRFKEGLGFEQIGNEFNVSRARIAEIEAKALRKLRRNSKRLRIFIDIDQLNDWEKLEEKAILLGIECKGLQFENEVLRSELWKRLQNYKGSPSIDDIIQARRAELLGLADPGECVLTEGIDEFELPIRTYKNLKRAGFNDIKDLINSSIDDIVAFRRSGRKAYDEMFERLGPHIPVPIAKVMERFERIEKYRDKRYKHYYVSQENKRKQLLEEG